MATIVETLRRAGCVYAEDEAALLVAAAADSTALDAMLARRVAGDPLEQILGWAEFCGLRIAIEPAVFVPRRRTEFLVQQAVALKPAIVIDMCCGSGAVGAALAASLGPLELYAADLHPAAVRCARRNLDGVGQVYQGDLFDPLPASLRSNVDLIVANAPYVPTDEIAMMPPEARDHEPHLTLDGGSDGVDLHRRIATASVDWLRPGGYLLIETSGAQASLTAAAMNEAGLTASVATDDDLEATVAIGRRT